VLLVPNFHPPHKQQRLAPYRHRKKMTSLAIAADSGLALEPVEEGRPGPSYTVETLAGLKRLYPGATIFLIVGADQYADMRNWHRPSDLTRLAKVVVVSRPGSPRPRIFPGHAASRVLFRDVIGVQISAAAVRDRLAKGLSVRYMLPAPVVRYVLRRRLYSGQSAGCAPRLH
jgi:nicotinate-nucleotide adenylyltransferase